MVGVEQDGEVGVGGEFALGGLAGPTRPEVPGSSTVKESPNALGGP